MVIVIGITGPTTSGKSTISQELQKILGCQILCVDGYFKINMFLPKVEINGHTILDFDDKDSVDWPLFIEDIESEIDKAKCQKKEYLIIEGFLLFGDPKIFDFIDILITINFNVKTDQELAFKRRINRYKRNSLLYDKGSSISEETIKKINEEEEEIPEDYETNPDKNNLNHLAFYFNHVAWPHIENNEELVCPKNWKKPVLKLSATGDINQNIKQSIDFIEQNKPSKCRL